jgi:STE24 endopeptidase
MLFAVVEVFFLLVSPVLNWWSRRLESDADRFALQLTRDPSAFAGAMERLASQNLAEHRPPRWAEVLLASHPPLYRRIELARSWSN